MKYDGVKQTMHRAEEEQEEGIASGMTLDTNEDPEDEHGEVTEEGEASVVKPSRPKTKKQRRKAALLLREVRYHGSFVHGRSSDPLLTVIYREENVPLVLRGKSN